VNDETNEDNTITSVEHKEDNGAVDESDPFFHHQP